METTTSTSQEEILQSAAGFLRTLFPRPIKRVLLVNPPDAEAALFRRDTAQRRRYTNYPSYGLGVLAQRLREVGVEPKIVNLNHRILKTCVQSVGKPFDFDRYWQEELERELKEHEPDLVGVTCMFTMTHTSLKHVCTWLKEHCHAPLAVGGVHASNDADLVLREIPQVDLVFLREADLSLPHFVDFVNEVRPETELGQMVLNAPGGHIELSGNLTPQAADLDVLPAYDLLDTAEYSEFGVIGSFYFLTPPGTRIGTSLSNRGCRGQCTFCSVRNFNGAGVRQRSVQNVVDELEMLKEQYDVRHISWLDDDLLKDHGRSVDLFNEMVRRKLGITWDATNGVLASSCTEEVIAAAAESGCIALNIGMESGNRRILRQIRKPGSVEKFLEAASVLRHFPQIHSSVFLMIGFPDETMRMILDTINVARTMDLDWYRISQLQPLPNTPLHDAMVAQGLIHADTNELRFMGGAYGKQTEIEHGRRLATSDFEEAFHSIALDAIPNAEQLTDIWFYMNYHLNFHRLFKEERPEKLEQQVKNLENLSDRISPENGFAAYFLGYLGHRLHGMVEQKHLARLSEILDRSPYWRDRLAAFGLSIEDLRLADFGNKDIPVLVPGSVSLNELAH